MDNLKDAEIILRNTIKDKTTHQDYKRTCEYATRMRRLVTGDGLEVELKRFVNREDDEWFQQRVTLTQLITPSICARLMSPAFKISRVKPVVKKIDFETEKKRQLDAGGNVPAGKASDAQVLDTKTKIEKLKAAAGRFYGEQDVDVFLEQRLIPLIYIDPNAFVLTTFDKFDNTKTTAKPYPTIIYSEDAVNYEVINDSLQWLIVKRMIQYELNVIIQDDSSKQGVEAKTEKVKRDGDIYWIYIDNDVIEYKQVDYNLHRGSVETFYKVDGNLYYKIDNDRVFQVSYYKTKAGMVQAKRVGCIPDESTKGRTCVSPLQPAMPYLLKSIKAVSELDISVSLHVFLQKFIYEPPCTGESATKGCDMGKAPDGSTCSVCKGTGFLVHTSGQDVIRLALPRDPNNAFQLDKLIHYANTPIDIVKFLDEYISKIQAEATKSIYNSDIYVRSTVASTATEKNIEMQSVNDALHPIAKQYSLFWVFEHKIIANLIDLKGAIIEHQFGRDFKFESFEDLLARLKLADDSGAPTFVKQEINNDIASLLFLDRPEELKKMQVKQIFNPFNGKTIEEILWIVANNKCTKQHEILWSESATIFAELEEEFKPETGTWFYDLDYKKQKEQIYKKVDELIAAMEADQPPPAVTFGANGLPVGAAPQGENPPAPVAAN